MPEVLRAALGPARAIVLDPRRPLHDELHSAAALALVEAADDWDQGRGLAWSTWLLWKVRHAALEALRSWAGVPRSWARTGRGNVALEDAPVTTRDVLLASAGRNPHDAAEHEEENRRVRTVIAGMESRSLRAVCGYFFEDKDMKTIARDEGISPSRAAAIIKEALGGPATTATRHKVGQHRRRAKKSRAKDGARAKKGRKE